MSTLTTFNPAVYNQGISKASLIYVTNNLMATYNQGIIMR